MYRCCAVWDISHVPPRSPSLSEQTAEALTFPPSLSLRGTGQSKTKAFSQSLRLRKMKAPGRLSVYIGHIA